MSFLFGDIESGQFGDLLITRHYIHMLRPVCRLGQYAYYPGSKHTAQPPCQYADCPGSKHTARPIGEYDDCPGSMLTA